MSSRIPSRRSSSRSSTTPFIILFLALSCSLAVLWRFWILRLRQVAAREDTYIQNWQHENAQLHKSTSDKVAPHIVDSSSLEVVEPSIATNGVIGPSLAAQLSTLGINFNGTDEGLKMQTQFEEMVKLLEEKDKQIRERDKHIKRLAENERMERKLRARIEDKVSSLMIASVRANVAVLNVSKTYLPDPNVLVEQVMAAAAVQKSREKEQRKIKRMARLGQVYTGEGNPGVVVQIPGTAAARSTQQRMEEMKETVKERMQMYRSRTFNHGDEVSRMMIRSLLNTVDAFKENGTDVPERASEMIVKSISLDGEAEPPERESDYWEYVAERQDDRALAWQTAVREAAPHLLHGMKFRIEQANLKDVFMLYPWQLHPNAKVLAITKEAGKRHGRCALVGNSQRLLLTKRGEEIEAHDAVMRLNQAPIEGFDQFVGNKTTYRMINNAWSGAYGRKEKKVSLDDTVKSRLTLEENVTLIVSRTDEGQYFRTSKLLEKARPDVMTVLLSRQGVDVVGDILRAFKARVELMRGYPYPGKASPSSGFVGALLLLQLCNEVNVYGVGMGGQTTSWHYWEQRNFGSSREFSLDPHHSFDLEGDAMRAMDAEKLLNHIMIKDEEEKTVNELKEFIPAFLKDVKANNKLKWRTAVEEKERQEEEAREAREAEERERQYIRGNTTLTAQKFAADSKAEEQAAADAVKQNIRDPFLTNHVAYQSTADSDIDAQKELEEESRQSSALSNDLPDEEIRVGMHK